MLNNILIKSYIETKIYIKNGVRDFLKKEEGVTAVEYAIVVAGVAAVVMYVFGTDGPVQSMLSNTFTTLETQVKGIVGGGTGGG